jgi:DNA end-binding protein Ku
MPQDAGQAEAFAVVGQALINAERATIGQIAFAGRKSIIAVVLAEDRGTMAYTLRFESEIRSRSDYFRDIAEAPVNANALEMAEMLIVKRTAKFEPPKCVDGYEVAVRELVDARLKNQPLTVAPAPQNVGSLMDALRQSVGPMLVVKAPAKAPKATKTA